MIKKDQSLLDYEAKIKSLEELVVNQKEEVWLINSTFIHLFNVSLIFRLFKIRVLQETVHKECLERDELLENLNATKDELFIFKKNACI